MAKYFYEDLTLGRRFDCGSHVMTRDEIIAFATEFDAQPFHIDEDAAKASFFRGLVASGWHTASVTMRAVAEGLLLKSESMGAPGIDELKWLRPVRADDELSVTCEVIDRRESKSRPERGSVRFRISVTNQRGETVMTQENWIMFGRRPSA
ncbi:MaoC family dehydratase [Terrarubrum flagellatum]|uniref:MaoC family dehydratase n=1 Tax=Terrirubrum flagellatum TaxID=2895980 RepID=UPI0031455718